MTQFLKEYGIKEGDTITKINGKNVSLASELIFDNYTSDSKDLSFRIYKMECKKILL